MNYFSRVKYQFGTETRYARYIGNMHRCDGKEKLAKPGMVYVEDPINGEIKVVSEGSLVKIEAAYPFYNTETQKIEGGDELEVFVRNERTKAIEFSQSLPDGLSVGKMFIVGIGDGHAWYIVTKVTKKTATVEWRGFSPDRYRDSILGLGGAFPKDAIARQCFVNNNNMWDNF
jgi:hypothetical protein